MQKPIANPVPHPVHVAIETRTPASGRAAVVALVLLFVAVVLPAFAGRGLVRDLFAILTMLTLAQCWNLLAGYAGLGSVGHQAFVGIGAYAMFAGVILWGWDPVVAILLGGVAAALLAIPIAFFAFRLAGAYFAIGTWVIAAVVRWSVAQWKSLGGGTGTSLPREATSDMMFVDTIATLFDLRDAAARDVLVYWLALALAVATIAGVYALLRSRQGLALAAVRDNRVAARAVGVDAQAMNWMVFVTAAAITGLCGGLIYMQTVGISPDAAFTRRRCDRKHDSDWSVAAGGRARTGLDDNIRLDRGTLAPSNAALVRRVVDICDRPVATPAQARALLGLRGA